MQRCISYFMEITYSIMRSPMVARMKKNQKLSSNKDLMNLCDGTLLISTLTAMFWKNPENMKIKSWLRTTCCFFFCFQENWLRGDVNFGASIQTRWLCAAGTQKHSRETSGETTSRTTRQDAAEPTSRKKKKTLLSLRCWLICRIRLGISIHDANHISNVRPHLPFKPFRLF